MRDGQLEEHLAKHDSTAGPYDFQGAYDNNPALQKLLLPEDFLSTLEEIHEFLDREMSRAENNILAPPIFPFVERLEKSPEVRQALLAHFAFSPPHEFRKNRPHELIREHPIRVANLACILNLDDRTIIGLILHDDKEDATATHEILEKIFSRDTANDVDNYSIPEREELIPLYAEANPHLRYYEAAEALDRILKNFYKTRIQVHRLEWRGLLGKILDGISNLQDDAIDAGPGGFTSDFKELQDKNRIFLHNQGAFIQKLMEKFDGDQTHLEHMIHQINIWSWAALAIREHGVSHPLATILHKAASSILAHIHPAIADAKRPPNHERVIRAGLAPVLAPGESQA